MNNSNESVMAKTFGTGKLSKYHDGLIKRGQGVGRDAQVFFLRKAT